MGLVVNDYKYPIKFFIIDQSGAIIDTVPLVKPESMAMPSSVYKTKRFKKGLNKLNYIGVFKDDRTNLMDTVSREIQFYVE